MGAIERASADELVGRTLGEFVLREAIGEGGAGAIYRAEQPALGREAVVKVLRGASTARFLREAKLAAQIDHPYAAHVYAFGVEPDGTHWIAMELVRGTSLDRLLASSGPLPLARLVPLLGRICEVIHTAHEQGIVHRDIKPSNIMVVTRAAKLMPKLLDLGIAKHVEPAVDAAPAEAAPAEPTGDSLELTRDAGRLLGSPAYTAPEQWVDAAAVDRRADVYALGVMTYELLTGRHPFAAATTLVAMARAHGRVPVPALGDGFPAALDAAIARATAKRAADRYPTALAFAAALRDAAGLDVERTPPLLDDAVRAALVARAPRPIAEAAAALDEPGADRGRHAELALWRATTRTIAVYALAARTRTGPPPGGGDAPRVAELLRAIQTATIPDEDWCELARELVRPFAHRRDEHPLPELVEMLYPGGTAALLDLLAWQPAHLARLIGAAAFLTDYELVVPRGDVVDSWIGLRRTRRDAFPALAALPRDQAALLDRDGAPVLSVHPLIQVAAPSPGAAEELFVFDGAGRHGARLCAHPVGFERDDDAVWDWFRANLADARAREGEAVVADAPYRGLAAFSRDDAALFFGRERESQAFVNRLKTQGLIAVVGASGVGKSSFVQAGVLPALPAGWRAIVVRPGARPITTLAARLADLAPDLSAALADDPDALARALTAACRATTDGFVLVVDQFEELFTLCTDADEVRRYAEALVRASSDTARPVRVIVTLRDDFLVRAEQLAPLRGKIGPGLQILTTPAADDLRRTLEEPARRAGYAFEDPSLVTDMVGSVTDQPGALALLSFTALKLWDQRDRHFKRLTRRAYDALGGVGGALAQHAEEIRDAMTPREQGLLREAFRHLVTGDGTRAVMSRSELTEVLGGESALIDNLVAGRLLVTSEMGGIDGDRIEVIHEALLDAWPRLVRWRREDSENARLRDQLRAAARQWSERDRPAGLLWRDDALTEYQLWRRRYPGALTTTEDAFAEASLADDRRGRRRRRVALGAVLTMLVVGLAVMGVLRVRASRSAAEARARLVQSYTEQGRQALMSGQNLEALVYLTKVFTMGDESPVLRTMLGYAARPLRAQLMSIAAHSGKVWSVELDRDDRRLLTAGEDGTAKIWDAATGRLLVTLRGHDKVVYRAVWSPDGSRVVTASFDGTARLWTADGSPIAILPAKDGQVEVAAFSSDGARLITAGSDGIARVWSSSGELLHALAGDGTRINDCAFDPTSRYAITAGTDGNARIWELAHGSLVATLAHAAEVMSVSFRPDAARVATASWDGTARIWEVPSGRLVATLAGHGDKLDDVVFAPDGQRVATAGRDGTARIWDGTTGALLIVLRGHRGMVGHVDWDRASTRLVTASDDRSARVWDAQTGLLIASFEGHAGTVVESRFSYDGRRVVTGSHDGTAKLWDASDANQIARWPASGGACTSSDMTRRFVAVACASGTRVVEIETGRVLELPGSRRVAVDPTGKRVATLSDAAVDVWSLAPGGGARERSLRFDGESIGALAWSNDGASVAATSATTGRVAVWDVATGRTRLDRTEHDTPWLDVKLARGRLITAEPSAIHVTPLDPPDASTVFAIPGQDVEWMTLSPDEETLVSGGAGGDLIVWSLAGAAKPIVLRGHTEMVIGAQFDATSDRLVSASGDGTARVWELATGKAVAVFTGSPQFLADASFDPRSDVVVTIGGDGAVRLWDPISSKLIDQFGAHRAFGRMVIAGAAHRVVSVSWDGEIAISRVPVEDGSPSELERFVACRSPLALDDATGGLVPAPPRVDCGSLTLR